MYTKHHTVMIKKLKHITQICRDLYEEEGASAVFAYMNDYMERSKTGDVKYEHCKECNSETPAWRSICLICGQPTGPGKQALVDAVIDDLKENFRFGDYTVLDELLMMLNNVNLIQALPEEQWNKFKHLRP
jgi:hypothetical protein